MSHTITSIVNTTNTLTLTTNMSTNVHTHTTRTNANTEENTAISTRPSVFLGIEQLVKFSGNQQAGESSARMYIQTILDFQDIRNTISRTADDVRILALSIELEKRKQELIQL